MLLRLILIAVIATGIAGFIPLWLMLGLASVASLAILADFLWTMRTVRRTRVPHGTQALVGKTAIARTVASRERWKNERRSSGANAFYALSSRGRAGGLG